MDKYRTPESLVFESINIYGQKREFNKLGRATLRLINSALSPDNKLRNILDVKRQHKLNTGPNVIYVEGHALSINEEDLPILKSRSSTNKIPNLRLGSKSDGTRIWRTREGDLSFKLPNNYDDLNLTLAVQFKHALMHDDAPIYSPDFHRIQAFLYKKSPSPEHDLGSRRDLLKQITLTNRHTEVYDAEYDYNQDNYLNNKFAHVLTFAKAIVDEETITALPDALLPILNY